MSCRDGKCSFTPVVLPQPQPGVYLHYKGGIYEVLGTAIDTDTNEETIWYVQVSTGYKYTRKRSEWLKPARITRNGLVYEVPRYTLLTRLRRHLVQQGQLYIALQSGLPLQARIGITEVTVSAGASTNPTEREQAIRNAPWNQYQLVTAPLGQTVYVDTRAGDYVVAVSGPNAVSFGHSIEQCDALLAQWQETTLGAEAKLVGEVET